MSGNRKSEQEKVVIVNGKKIIGWMVRVGIAAVENEKNGNHIQ